ncbi:hypothetical protein K5N43_004283 [Vibrio vulnificus]|nr:hypothetical protein [Vibrio vulnificus]
MSKGDIVPLKESNDWSTLVQMADELRKCDDLGLINASITLCFVYIDTLSSLSRPLNVAIGSRKYFCDWVDRYLKAHEDQPYQYVGSHVYAARCAFLHAHSSEALLHEKNSDIPMFAYCDGGRHYFEPTVDNRMVIIGTRSFVNDVINAMSDFMDECGNDINLKARVQSRLGGVLQKRPMPIYS